MRHHEEKLSLLQDLISLSKVDDQVTYMEQNFIFTIANSLGIDKIEMEELLRNPIAFTPDKNEMNRITHFYRLILMMGVDSEYHQKEINFCKDAGLKMGLNPIAIKAIIERIITSETHQLSPQEIIEVFKTYHN
jgi:hypothetical protein